MCRSATEVKQTWEVAQGYERKRARVCKDFPEEHRFQTVERVSIDVRLEDVFVRHVGDGSLSEETFEPQRLYRDVERGVFNVLTDQQVHDVVDRATRAMQTDLNDMATSINVEESSTRGEGFAILDADIRQAVERALRLGGHRLGHVLYALSTLGRRDRTGRPGFETAADVLAWLELPENYPALARDRLIPDERQSVHWTPPPGTPPRPRTVIMRDLSTRRVFEYDQFLGDIRKAMVGRRDAANLSTQIAKWVLWNLAGQRQVLSGQLAAGVASGLRRVDDIAYLRWAAVEKNIQSVRELVAEAEALLESPSPRLNFIDSVAEL